MDKNLENVVVIDMKETRKTKVKRYIKNALIAATVTGAVIGVGLIAVVALGLAGGDSVDDENEFDDEESDDIPDEEYIDTVVEEA